MFQLRPTLAVLSLLFLQSHASAAQEARPTCENVDECRQLIAQAIEQKDYESAHDLAWRAVQLGPPRDPELMLLLARTQSLSGRPEDALVMLQRIVQLGMFPTEVITSDDFRRVRARPGWPELQARLEGRPAEPVAGEAAGQSGRARSPKTTDASASAAGAAATETETASPAPDIAQVLRFTAPGLVPGGLAYDAVSARFLVGSAHARKVLAIGEQSQRAIDLVRAESAGFRDVLAIEIDNRRGDLWVASGTVAEDEGDGAGDAASLHNLQLISGRPLASFPVVAPDGRRAVVAGLAVAPGGAVFALDTGAGRLWKLAPGGRTVEPLLEFEQGELRAVTVARDGLAYVAHRDGLLRVDLEARAVTPVTAEKGVDLAGIEALRWHAGALVAVQRKDDRAFRVARFRINRGGARVVAEDVLETDAVAIATPVSTTISGSDFYYLARGAAGELVVRRIRLN